MVSSSTESDDAKVRMTHIAASGMTTTALSGEEPTRDSTGSDSGKNESTATDSSLIVKFQQPWFRKEDEKLSVTFLDLWQGRIVEELEPGIFRVSLRKSSSNGSTGPSQEEAEPCD